jgi:hypothetical protein
MRVLLYCLCLTGCLLPLKAQINPDQITVFFPAFTGQETLGQNVSTVLSLQLAQTTRKKPWPHNPQNLDFGRGMFKWDHAAYSMSQYKQALSIAQSSKLLAQMIVLGNTQQFGSEVVVEVDVLLPSYQSSDKGCDFNVKQPCDFRQKNLEVWPLVCGQHKLYTQLPRRRYNMAGIVLDENVVARFRKVKGLPITPSIQSKEVIGYTGDDLQFLEFNRYLPNAPTKLRSKGNEGYVSLPKISKQNSEFTDMAGGIFQVFRGDWQEAHSSFSRVLNNPVTRIPLKVDAYLLRGMVQFRRGNNGLADLSQAVELAPYDVGAIRYQLTGMLAVGSSLDTVKQVLNEKRFLFETDDEWLKDMEDFVACSANES